MITLKNNSKSFDERISNLRNKVMQNAITLRKKIKNGTLFKFKPFSLKQKKILTWWTDKSPVKDKNGEDLIIYVKFPKRRLYLKVWQINVGRIKLYLLDSDIEKNNPEDRDVTLRLYGGDQEMRIGMFFFG
jgi:glucan phosphorylase